jgi:serine/threonine protein kinase
LVEVTVSANKTASADSLFGGRYQLESRIAAGGMGEVWQAYDEVLGRQVAVKVLRPEYIDDATFCERFRIEARNTAALSHPGIVQVYDFGETRIGSGLSSSTVPFIAMELVPGEPLSAIIAREGAMPVDRAASIVGQAAAALHAAHESRVVHRDVKPANLVVGICDPPRHGRWHCAVSRAGTDRTALTGDAIVRCVRARFGFLRVFVWAASLPGRQPGRGGPGAPA